MSGLNWTSYNSSSFSGDNLNYTDIVNFFASPPSTVSTGTIQELQIVGGGGDTPPQIPNFTIFTGSTDNVAIKFYGYFIPPTTGNWTFNIGVTSSTSGTSYTTDDVGFLFLGPPNSTITPSQTYTSLSTTPSSSTPIIYNNYTTDISSSFSSSMSLIAGNSYPILFYFNQSVIGYALGFSFSLNGGSFITNFSGYVYTSPNIPCFKEGTKILTDKGYRRIEDLRKGDLVKTVNHGFKQIDTIGKRDIYHPASQERIKDQLYTCSQSKYPELFEELIITGAHSILVDDFINEEQKEKVIEVYNKIYVTDNKYRLPACADSRALVYETPGTYTIYHIALENDNYYMNYGIYANGLLVETCSKRYLKESSNMTLIE